MIDGKHHQRFVIGMVVTSLLLVFAMFVVMLYQYPIVFSILFAGGLLIYGIGYAFRHIFMKHVIDVSD